MEVKGSLLTLFRGHTAYRWLFLVLPGYAAFAFGRSSWPLAAAFAVAIITYNVTTALAEQRWPDWVRSRVVFLRCVEIGLACIALSYIYLRGANAALFEFYYDGFYAVPVIFAASAAGRRGLVVSVAVASLAVAFGQVVITPQPDVLLSRAALDYWSGVGAYTGIYAVFFATVGGLATLLREYGARRQHDMVFKLAASFGRLRDAVLIADAAGRVMSLNRAAERLFGRRGHDAFSRPVEEMCRGLRLDEAAGSAGASDATVHVIGIRRDGSEFSCEATVSAYDFEGETVAYAIVARDVSARLRIEEALAQQSRLATLGTLTSGVAHDIGNPLTGIRALAQALLEEDGRTEQEFEALELIRDETRRLGDMLRDLMDFARADRSGRSVVKLNDVVERALRLRAFASGAEGVTVRADLAEPSPRVLANAGQIEQIVLNLVTNGEQAIGPAGGELVVRTRSAGEEALIDVEDDGPGIPEKLRERIFDPFFTTKESDEGTGLGLFISREIVRDHGGELEVKSRLGQGTCFRVRLPYATGLKEGPLSEITSTLRAVG